MAANALGGPLIVFGRPGGAAANATGPFLPDYNPDQGPSPFDVGAGLLDPRFGYFVGGSGFGLAGGETCAYIFMGGGGYVAIDQAPVTKAANNIAAAANVASGVAMTLVSSTAAGITVPTTATTVLNTGKVVPSTSLIIGPALAWITFGQNKTVGLLDPRTSIARAVSITDTAGSGGHFIVSGYDLYGVPMSENINQAGSSATTNGKKAFKFVTSVVPQFTDANNYSVGTTDIVGFPLRVDEFAFAGITWNNAGITASTGFVAADATSPATTTTGDVRGTYAVQTAADSTKRLQVFIEIPPWNALDATAGAYTGLFGTVQA